ncbi:MAG TPA: outer membrane lipoprotein carrier protein LolA, partial [Candidatus Polarisedimenticolia bacterium]|nr:outer membrane lipoprotein carrier protein LolA [Candidatus Polarisedimenticolia bacterium]
FVQRLDSRSLGRPRVEEGIFMIRKPSFMRWEYRKPEEKLAVADGEHTWLYLPEEREVHKGRAADLQRSGAAALLLAGRLRLDRDFEARLSEGDSAGADPPSTGTQVLELRPLAPDTEFERVLLTVEIPGLSIRRLVLVDALGDRMSFDLSAIEENPDLSDDLFSFRPPPGVRVIETAPPQP